ncbi:MAG: hypothetical protein ACM3YN_08565 [Parcubacteria group bacterium]
MERAALKYETLDFDEFVRELVLGHAQLLTGKDLGGPVMSKTSDLFWDQFDAVARRYREQGMDVDDACDRAACEMLEVLLAEMKEEERL